jgi:hypothetical protein
MTGLSRQWRNWLLGGALVTAAAITLAGGGGAEDVPADLSPEQRAETDIYVLNRAMFRRAGPEMNGEAYTTALIKKHLALLMYPVDLGSFKPPGEDPRFQEQIKAFQGRLGVAVTGMLTWAQFEQLQQAATLLGERRLRPPAHLQVRREKLADGEAVQAEGSWLGGDRRPASTRIHCRQAEALCLESGAEVALPDGTDPDYRLLVTARRYRVTGWGGDEVVAEAEAACRQLRLVIDTRRGNASLESAFRAGEGCADDGAKVPVLRLGNGDEAARRFHAERRAAALRLAHETFQP